MSYYCASCGVAQADDQGECPVCGYDRYESVEDYEPVYECPECPDTFDTERGRDAHYRQVHEDEGDGDEE